MTVSMPDVDLGRDFAACLAEARGETPGPGRVGKGRHVALITPGRLVMILPCPPPEAVSDAMVASIRAIVPEELPQVIASIAFTDVVRRGVPDASAVNERIPFTGYLLGMAFVGHNVVVFEGHPSALAAGCAGSDLLVVDSAMADHLQDDWAAVAARAMRRPRILLFRRDGRVEVVDPSAPRPVKPAPAPPRKRRRWWPF